ncbi:tetratricopeptide repeat protein [Balneola sp. MJW-20]|uniref:tetratricopeptide repeat protein n=1 Tax=Gracilimonas aurantiaca TaxID=3234185 RepID=UPI003464ECB6
MALTNRAKSFIKKNHKKRSAAELAKKLNADEAEIRAYIDEISQPIPLKKKLLFYGITFSIPFLFFILLEAGLRGLDYMGDTELFINPNIKGDEYLLPNPNFAARYFFYTKTIPNPSTDVFLAEKPENGYRVFAMGGSSAAGYPYGFNGTFSRVVDDILSDAMPDKEVEVVNVATSAISTYTLFDQVDEIIEQDPDAIMIYAGHNEFYGALGVGSNETLGGFPGFVRFYLKLQRFKTFLLLRNLIVEAGRFFTSDEDMAKPGATLMERIISSRSIELNGPKYELAMIQFRSNMSKIIEQFQDTGIKVYLSTIASNVKDQPPFVVIKDTALPPADEVYMEGRSAFESGDFTNAGEQFNYAKDLDGLKFRAPTEINTIITELSNTYDNAVLVSSLDTLQQNAVSGIIGNDLMLEHLHPNDRGYFLIGRTFAEQMMNDLEKQGLLQNEETDLSGYREKMYLSEFDERMIWHRIRTLKQGFPFVQDGSGITYQSTYKPVSKLDSLAFEAVHVNKRWDEAKVELAQYYEKRGQIDKALLEYRGLIRNQPWNDSPYVFAARLYLDRNDFDNAYPLLQKAYELAPNEAFTTKMLGAIELNSGNTKKAIDLLERSRSINPDDPQMLYNLSGAYGTDQQFRKAMDIANEVIRINPSFPGIQQWKAQLESIIQSRGQN